MTALAAGRALAARLDTAVLVKGGHLDEQSDEALDTLIQAGGAAESFAGPRIRDGHHIHGTGCALATAIAAHLATGRELVEACRLAKQYVTTHIASPVRSGRGAASLV